MSEQGKVPTVTIYCMFILHSVRLFKVKRVSRKCTQVRIAVLHYNSIQVKSRVA